MDVTETEAELIADHLQDLGPEFNGYGVMQGLVDVQKTFPERQYLQVVVRSRASAALAGPATPDFKQRDG